MWLTCKTPGQFLRYYKYLFDIDKSINVKLEWLPKTDNKHKAFTNFSGKKPKKFIIEVEKGLARIEVAELIGHEMRHVSQVCSGKFCPITERSYKWKNKIYTDVPYSKQHCEIDAYKENSSAVVIGFLTGFLTRENYDDIIK